MYKIRYKVYSLSPLVFPEKFGDNNMVYTKRYIPGSTVLGILANRLINKKNDISFKDAHENEFFYDSFLIGDLIISNAYILNNDNLDNFDNFDNQNNNVPTPFSIVNKKNTTDLFDLLFYENEIEKKDISNKFCVFESEDTVKFTEVKTSINFHHARDRKKGISKDAIIFNYESILPYQTFSGDIRGEKSALEELINICKYSWIAFAGKSKSNQYAKIKFEIIDEKPELISQDNIFENNSFDINMPISFTLVSDTILHNEFGYCATDVNTLKKYLGKGVKVLKAFAKAGQVESFVGKWGLKKPLETCFLAGSCFLLDISNAELSKLNELNKFGIGEKTNEGFGKCIFSLQTTDELTELNIDNDYYELDEPEVPVPDKTKEIIKILIQNYIIKQSSSMAFSDQYRFKNLPTKSFINKLESIAIKGNSFEFKDNIKELIKRDFSKKQLQLCKNNNETLLEYLTNFDISVEKVNSNLNLEKMCKKINYEPGNDKELENKVFDAYFSTFFLMMRKTRTQEG